MREKKRLEHVLANDVDLARRSDDIAAYFDLSKEGENVDADLQREIGALRELLDRLETETLLSGENDARNASTSRRRSAETSSPSCARSKYAVMSPERRTSSSEVASALSSRFFSRITS